MCNLVNRVENFTSKYLVCFKKINIMDVIDAVINLNISLEMNLYIFINIFPSKLKKIFELEVKILSYMI